jgi:spermidine synthase
MAKTPFDFWERNGRLGFQRGDVRIYYVGREQYLFVGQTMYASTVEREWYIKNVMPHARGKVLEIGLGLGCASKVILANPRVSHLLTIESNEDVIAAYGQLLHRHHVLLADIYEWIKSVPKDFSIYDLIFVDHYVLDEDQLPRLEQLAEDLFPLLKKDGRMIFWIDENADEEDKERVRSLWQEK